MITNLGRGQLWRGQCSGSGHGLAEGRGLATSSTVNEQQMAALYGEGRDPVSGAALEKGYPTFTSLGDRIARKVVVALPGSPKALDLAWREILLPEAGHLVAQARGS